jgi:hypothetical protein
MGIQPLVLKGAQPYRAVFDPSTLDEDLPTGVTKDVDGRIVARTTTVTKVAQETTDDN